MGHHEQEAVRYREKCEDLEKELSTNGMKLKDKESEINKVQREYESVLQEKKRYLELDKEQRKQMQELEDKMKQDQHMMVDMKN